MRVEVYGTSVVEHTEEDDRDGDRKKNRNVEQRETGK